MKKLICIGWLACTVTTQAAAANWELVTELYGDGGVAFIDRGGVAELGGGYKKAWFKFAHAKEQPIETVTKSVGQKFYAQSMALVHFDCKGRRSAWIQGIYNAKDGTPVWNFSIESYAAQWVEVAPETIGESMLDAACYKG